jgi:PAT family beta-lactamase induction signal transducer AmpG
MAAGAAMAVVGWWTGYKLGGVIALFTAEYFQNIGIENYWQLTFLILGIVVILMNIGLMFVHEAIKYEENKQKENDKLIQINLENKIFTQIICLDKWNYRWSNNKFFKKNGFQLHWNFRICFFI